MQSTETCIFPISKWQFIRIGSHKHDRFQDDCQYWIHSMKLRSLSSLIYLSLHRFSIATEQNYYNTLCQCCQCLLVILAPQRGLEPRTNWLTVNYSTTELQGNKFGAPWQNRTAVTWLQNRCNTIILIGQIGGGDKDRTCYILLAKQALSQMSYTPVCFTYRRRDLLGVFLS